jgi:glutamine synthetase
LRAAGVTPDSFLPEYGARQFEITVKPQPALRAADHAVITREMARGTAHRLGHRAIFSPMPAADGVGNGMHIHMSLWDALDRPATHDPSGPLGLTQASASFAAGILHHLPAICAMTAPSPVSYLRLTPNRWAPTSIDVVRQDRGAALRVCPVFAAADMDDVQRQFNMEFRVTDGSASPYLALGAILFAGADGVKRGLGLSEIQGAGLPRSLDAALDTMEASAAVQRWFGPVFLDAYLRHKRSERAHVRGLSDSELCARYAEVY